MSKRLQYALAIFVAGIAIIAIGSSCGKSTGGTSSITVNCVSENTSEGVKVTCNDGTTFVVQTPTPAPTATPAPTGTPGGPSPTPEPSPTPAPPTVIETMDPCGDKPKHKDQLLYKLPDGRVAIYHGKNVEILDAGITYKTSDSDQCRFMLNSAGEFEYESHRW